MIKFFQASIKLDAFLYVIKEGDVVKFADHLSKETIKKFNEIRNSPIVEKQPEPTPKNKDILTPKKPEQLSRKDWEELMGTRRDTYSRVRGAMRRK